MIPTRKLTFQEAWQSTTVFYVDDVLEDALDQKADQLMKLVDLQEQRPGALFDTASLANFLTQADEALDVVVYDIGLSIEKLLRIVSLLRILGEIPGGFDKEWSVKRIKRQMAGDPAFALLVAKLLMDGVRSPVLVRHIPKYYLETLNYREIQMSSRAARRSGYKRALIGTYGGKKGYRVEARIKAHLEQLAVSHGVTFEQGRSNLVDTNLDFAIPGVADPWIIIMSSFQETTSSGQSAKTRDMFSGFQNLQRRNSIHGEHRVFVNFVDGGGWLARKRDFQRLIENCHYSLNLAHLDMLESIVLQHLPGQYGARPQQA